MTWEWSHAPEAYEDARTNLYNVEPATLREIFAEWRGHLCNVAAGVTGGSCQHCYEDAQTEAQRLSVEQLAAFIWEQASEQRDCTNGGHMAHLCPYGCGCHMVPFDTAALDEAAD